MELSPGVRCPRLLTVLKELSDGFDRLENTVSYFFQFCRGPLELRERRAHTAPVAGRSLGGGELPARMLPSPLRKGRPVLYGI